MILSKNNLKPLLYIGLSFTSFLQGCSYFTGDDGMFRAREKDYLRAATVEPMKVPEELKTASLESQFKIPDVNAKDDFGDSVSISVFEIPRPIPVSDDAEEFNVTIQSLGGKRWIFLNVPTAHVWPQTQGFLSEYKAFPVNSVPARGLIETNWIEFKDDKTTRSRYRISIEKGVHPETTEVHVLQTQSPVDALPAFGESFAWPEKSDSTEREAWLLDELAAVLAKGIQNSAASLMGQHVGGKEKAVLTRYNNEPALQLRLPAVRANASVLHAVQSEGFVKYDVLSGSQVFYFGYPFYKSAKQGFWSRVAFWKSRNKVPSEGSYPAEKLIMHLSDTPEAITAFGHISTAKSADALPKAQGYLVVLRPSVDGIIALVRNVRGERLSDDKAKEILRLLRTSLI